MVKYCKFKGESNDEIVYVQKCNNFIYEPQADLGKFEEKKLKEQMREKKETNLHNNERLREILNCIIIKM